MQTQTRNPGLDTRGFSRQSMQCSGRKVVWFERGEGPPLVYFHGGGTFHGIQFAATWAATHRVILPYHPNFGDSDDNPAIHAMHHYVLHYAEFLDRLGLGSVDLVGSSFGGNLAAEVALYQKHRIGKLVLSAPAGLATAEILPTDLSRVAPGEVLSLLVTDMTVLAPYLPEPGDAAFGAARAREGAAMAAVMQNRAVNGLQLADWLGRLRDLPSLVLWGENDRVLPVQMADLWQSALGSRVQTFPRMGHLLFDESEQARAAALAFLAPPVA